MSNKGFEAYLDKLESFLWVEEKGEVSQCRLTTRERERMNLKVGELEGVGNVKRKEGRGDGVRRRRGRPHFESTQTAERERALLYLKKNHLLCL